MREHEDGADESVDARVKGQLQTNKFELKKVDASSIASRVGEGLDPGSNDSEQKDSEAISRGKSESDGKLRSILHALVRVVSELVVEITGARETPDDDRSRL